MLRRRAVCPGDDATAEDRSEGERAIGLYVENRRDCQLALELGVASQGHQGENLVLVHLLVAVAIAADHLRNLQAAGETRSVDDEKNINRYVSHQIGRVNQGTSGHDTAFL